MRVCLCLALLLVAASCAAGGSKAPSQDSPGPSLPGSGSGSAGLRSTTDCKEPFADSPSLKFSATGWKTDFCQHSVPYEEIRSGGPPRDGIPPIDQPKFVSNAEASQWIKDVEPVIALEVDGEARAYPLQILIWHEIVNDEIGGVPVAVTFCPLCYAAVVFRRPTIEGQELTFGTSGNLRHSDMVMWDRQTESWWQQFKGLGIVGTLTGTQLDVLPAAIVSWKSFKKAYPAAKVLSRDTGIKRAYGKNPYVGYDDVSKKPFLYRGKVGKGLAPMEHVVGVMRGQSARAYSVELLRQRRVIHDNWKQQSLVVFWQKGAASALDKEIISSGDDAGATGVFLSALDGRQLHFVSAGESGFRDEETSSEWNIFGHATSGPHKGRRLESVAHHRVFWFAWSAFVADKGTLYAE